MKKVDTEAVRQKAIEIVKLAEDMKPDEYIGAIAIAAGTMIQGLWPDKIDEMAMWFANTIVQIAADTVKNKQQATQ